MDGVWPCHLRMWLLSLWAQPSHSLLYSVKSLGSRGCPWGVLACGCPRVPGPVQGPDPGPPRLPCLSSSLVTAAVWCGLQQGLSQSTETACSIAGTYWECPAGAQPTTSTLLGRQQHLQTSWEQRHFTSCPASQLLPPSLFRWHWFLFCHSYLLPYNVVLFCPLPL